MQAQIDLYKLLKPQIQSHIETIRNEELFTSSQNGNGQDCTNTEFNISLSICKWNISQAFV